MRYPSTEPARNRQLINRSSLGGHAVNEHPEAATFDPLIGRKVWTRWPADNSFYEALVTDYDAAAVCSINSERVFLIWIYASAIP